MGQEGFSLRQMEGISVIEEFNPYGYENRISRPTLVAVTGWRDRVVRDEISSAIERGVMIASQDGGYFQWRDRRDDPYFEDYMRGERSRERKLRQKNKRQRLAWEAVHPTDTNSDKQVPGQLSFEW